MYCCYAHMMPADKHPVSRKTADVRPLAASKAARESTRVPGISLHRQLYLNLRDRIVSGAFKEGAALPTEEALCEEFQVSRITVRRALTDLAAHGMVQRRHGLGTFVLHSATAVRAKPSLSFIDDLRQAGRYDVEVLSFEHAVPPPDITGLLQIDEGLTAVHAVRARSTTGVPLMHTDAWVPEGVGKAITSAALRKKPMYQLLMVRRSCASSDCCTTSMVNPCSILRSIFAPSGAGC